MDGFLAISFVFLIAGVVAVPIASKLGLGSVLGYLIAGIAISPVLHSLHVDVISLQHFAEFGVVMMLFLVGLELEPRILWKMRHKLLGLGGLQVTLTTLAVMSIAMLLDQPWTVSLAVGLVLALSSTAIILQTLNEKGLMKSDGGEASFSVLLFQDIAVIPILALIPLLALPEWQDTLSIVSSQGDHSNETKFIDTLPGWQRGGVTLAAIAVVIIGGNYLIRPLLNFIAVAKLRELFTAAALLLVIGIALLMSLVGLSPALGTFLAGVVLANSEYRHELESDVAPFKGLLLGLFFMTVGASINFGLLFESFGLILMLTLGLMTLKVAVMLLLSFLFKVHGSDRWLLSLGLAQAGEFGFVLLSFTVANSVIPVELADKLLLVVALSMLFTPVLFILYDKVIAPRFSVIQSVEAEEIDHRGEIIIAGHGRFGGVVNRILLGAGYQTVVLDHHSEQLELLRKFGFKVFYGDATRPDMLHAAGIDEASSIVIAIDDADQATELTRYVRSTYPNIHIAVRAHHRHHVYELFSAGANDIIREYFDSAVRTGRSVLEALGEHPYLAEQQIQSFVSNDQHAMRALAEVYNPTIPLKENHAYIEKAKGLRESQENDMRNQKQSSNNRSSRGWMHPKVEDIDS